MKDIYIVCVDDEPDVLRAVTRDLAPLEEGFPVETAGSADDAERVIDQILDKGNYVGLILCDHVMPGKSGVNLLIELRHHTELEGTRKVLFTGQAGLEDTVEAINKAKITHFLAKPWEKEELVKAARDELTSYIISTGLDPLPHMRYLDQERLAEYVRQRNRIDTGQ